MIELKVMTEAENYNTALEWLVKGHMIAHIPYADILYKLDSKGNLLCLKEDCDDWEPSVLNFGSFAEEFEEGAVVYKKKNMLKTTGTDAVEHLLKGAKLLYPKTNDEDVVGDTCIYIHDGIVYCNKIDKKHDEDKASASIISLTNIIKGNWFIESKEQ